jgi:hypothetical protein
MLGAICQAQPRLTEFVKFALSLGIARSLRGRPACCGFSSTGVCVF